MIFRTKTFRVFGLLSMLIALAGAVTVVVAQPSEESTPKTATLIEVQDAIGPATSHFIRKGIDRAAERGDAVMILALDTPGGLDSAMREIIQAILASPVPVVTYITPRGARAASAGTYILYASHVAAMAPATNLGSATPVAIGGSPPGGTQPADKGGADAQPNTEANKEGGPDADTDAKAGSEQPSSGGTAMERKTINDAIAYIRGLAETHGRNADWAEKAVRDAANLSAEQALEQNVIDVIAADIPDLLAKIEGRTVVMSDGEKTIAAAGAVVERLEPDWRTKLLAVITNPTIAYLLMLIGIYGLIFEGYNPGALVPGVVGAICLLLALYAFQVLPVNYAGLALIVLGIVLMAAEAFVPSFGALGIGGILAFVFGSIILIDTEAPGFAVSKPLIGGLALFSGALVFGIILFAVKSFRRPVETGLEAMLGAFAVAREDFERTGNVFIHGESWSAVSSAPVRNGQRVRVTAIDGLVLNVEPEQSQEAS
ncbi:MAG: nodulation protein NfeD [Gammaproteobacteria bacterium]|nr:nodulation protein NfeD [Gammaproteobacteria bacterium]